MWMRTRSGLELAVDVGEEKEEKARALWWLQVEDEINRLMKKAKS